MTTLFYVFGVLCLYSYFLYPLILKLLPVRASIHVDENIKEHAKLPVLSLIITVHNEAARIREKLDNTLQFDYPEELLEIIVASDFSVWKEFLCDNQCGITVNSMDSVNVAKTIIYLLENSDERKRMGENGKQFAMKRYNWEAESKKLLNLYKELSK